METIEKVIKKLEYCTENKCDICQEENDSGFPWIDGRCYGFTERLYDAIALLKAQEAIEPSTYHHLFICPVCKNALFEGQKFCHECGRAVKWG